MAEKKYYIGSVGPFLYDDTDLISDLDEDGNPTGDFTDQYYHGFVTDGQMLITEAPDDDNEVMRLGDVNSRLLAPLAVTDINDPSTELGAKAGIAGTLILVYQINATRDEATLYAWDAADSEGVDAPYVVAGSSGFWIAVGGKYNTGSFIRNIIFSVKEEDTSVMAKGQVATVTGSSGTRIEVGLCDCDDVDKIRTLGIVYDNISQNGNGNLVYKGLLEKVDTRTTNTDVNPNGETWAAGELLWVSQTAGGMTKVRPTSGRSIKAARSVKGNSNTDTLIVLGFANPVWMTAASGEDLVQRMGDNGGANKISFRDYANNEVGSIDSNGDAELKILVSRLGSPTYDDLQDYLNTTRSAGYVEGGLITAADPADGTVDISTIKGWIRETESEIGVLKTFDLTGSNLELEDKKVNYIFVDYYQATSPYVRFQVTTDRSTIGLNTEFPLGRVYRDGTSTHIAQSGLQLANVNRKGHERLIYRGFERVNGAIISEPADLKLASTAGIVYMGANKIVTPAQNTNTGDKFTAWYYDGDLLGGADWVSIVDQTDIDNANYNDITSGLVGLGTNRFGVYWIWLHMDGDLHVIYGRGNYTLAQAEAISSAPDTPLVVSCFGILAAKIIAQEGEADLYSIVSAYEQFFPISAPTDHNDLGGLQGGTANEYYHLLAAEYTELSEWLDNVTLGDNGLTTVPEIVLTPAAAALSDVVGGMYFSNVDTGVYVCTSL